ncbi:hydrolase [uncultured Halomonas sp.]|uniref:hydrolase n=1 Tax=uncultured Halomonas sp. TaxID=173971 RepID=UPI0026274027|nr:hydrolase [uncultured Halomonas sp.]
MSGRLHRADFTPPAGLANCHVQTLLPRLLPRRRLPHRWECLTLPDGDFVELTWVEPGPEDEAAPLFLLFHGLEGSFASPYARELLGCATDLGWRAVMMHFRGCGRAPNRLPRAYHSGDTADAYWVIGQLAKRYPRALKVAAGVSLGANMLVKLVAEQGGDGLDLAGAIAISAPLDLAASADCLQQGFARVYQRHLLASLKARAATRLDDFPLALDARTLGALASLRDYDDKVTAPLHGFRDANDYYQRASAGRWLGELELPTLVLHAEDDPFMPADLFARLPAPGDAVRVELSARGGHVGFMEWREGRLRSWLARRVARQLGEWASTGAPTGGQRAGARGLPSQ